MQLIKCIFALSENLLLGRHYTKKKDIPSAEVIGLMRETMKIEYEFYNYVVKKFGWNV